MKLLFSLLAALCLSLSVHAQKIDYPYPVRYLQLQLEQQSVKMAYMDVPAEAPNGRTVVLLHGKNFNGYYWKDLVATLNTFGYRVIVPDQVGWGLSDKPGIHYSFHLLAANTKVLLDSLGIGRVQV
ncbi:MAG: alpha/beta hydrolase, partial [Sphingobacteriales bacterium]